MVFGSTHNSVLSTQYLLTRLSSLEYLVIIVIKSKMGNEKFSLHIWTNYEFLIEIEMLIIIKDALLMLIV